MKNTYKLLVFLVIFIITLGACNKDEDEATTEPSDYDVSLLEAVNAHRVEIGLIPLQHNDFLWGLAHEHSTYMANQNAIATSTGLEERITKIKQTLGLGAVAEIVAVDKGTASEVVSLWLGSISLKEKIEGNYNLTGLSAVKGSDGNWYFTEIFYNQ